MFCLSLNLQVNSGLMERGWMVLLHVTPWRSGRPLAWDFTCCDTFAPTYLSLAASGARMVVNQAESRKRALYQDIESTHDFVPIAIETSAWCFRQWCPGILQVPGPSSPYRVSRPIFEHFDSTNRCIHSEV